MHENARNADGKQVSSIHVTHIHAIIAMHARNRSSVHAAIINRTSTKPQTTTQRHDATENFAFSYYSRFPASVRCFACLRKGCRYLHRHFCQTVTRYLVLQRHGKSLNVGSTNVTEPGDGRSKGFKGRVCSSVSVMFNNSVTYRLTSGIRGGGLK